MVLVGINGTGKTQVLAKLAQAISGINRDAGSFEPRAPKFRKVIAVSYSAFDNFDLPEGVNRVFNYVYCGIRAMSKDGKSIILNNARERFAQAAILLARPSKKEQFEFWSKLITERIPSYIVIPENKLTLVRGRDIPAAEQEFQNGIRAFYDSLSAGQRAMVVIFTEIIANIERESIILFDEPELHQHPTSLSSILFGLREILEKFDSYAIVATHSPLVLQEVPAKFVRIIDREGEYPIIKTLKFEPMGESIDGIIDLVFGFPASRNNYLVFFSHLAERYSEDDVLKFFDGKLGLQARIFLSNLYPENETL